MGEPGGEGFEIISSVSDTVDCVWIKSLCELTDGVGGERGPEVTSVSLSLFVNQSHQLITSLAVIYSPNSVAVEPTWLPFICSCDGVVKNLGAGGWGPENASVSASRVFVVMFASK